MTAEPSSRHRCLLQASLDARLVGGISNPLEVIEQITYLLFIRRLDEIQLRGEEGPLHRGNRQPGVPAGEAAPALVAAEE